MSGPKWTQPQRCAIEDEGGALLVSAAAGSGKTAVLVERAVRLITRDKDPVDADRLLILTFTNAAAEELRSRIGVRLENEVHARPGDVRLRKQRLLLRRAFIGTLDAYCLQLVRENFAVLQLPPDIGLADEAMQGQLREQAIAETMEEMFGDEAFSRFAGLYGRARSDRMAEQTVLELYKFTRTLPYPETVLAGYAAMYESTLPLEDSAWGKELLAYAHAALEAAEQLAAQAVQLAAQDSALAAWMPALEEDAAGLAGLQKALRAGWDKVVEAMSCFVFAALKATRGGDAQVKAAVKQSRDAVKGIVDEVSKKCFCCTAAQFEEDKAEAGAYVGALVRAVGLFAQKYTAAKLEEKALDFADYEHLSLELLQNPDGSRTPLANRVAARYSMVMVDEYQDTNELQSALYESLALPDGSNLFYVGDVKQSIYRFRNANPGLFLQKKESWPPYDGQSHPAVITLGHNFRSAQGVIDGVNHVFGLLMSPALGEVDYKDGEGLIKGGENPLPGGLELCVVEGDTPAEAEWVAGRIAQMLKNDEQVYEKGQTRPCNPGDFCVLLRVKKNIPTFLAALEKQGVPAVADLADSLLETPEVLPLVSVLTAIDNPGDDIALTAALLGPLFRFTPDEVTRVRALAPKGRVWAALQADESAKVKGFLARFAYFRALAAQEPVGKLCEEIVDSTAYLSAVAAMEDGSTRRENLQRFIGWAAQVGAAGRGGLAGFVRILQAGTGPQPPAVKTVPGHVSILTIHKSKGLEFPFCFLADAAHRFNRTAQSQRVQMHAGLGLGMALRQGDTLYPTLPLCAIRLRSAAEERSEEMRGLYVALTRAGQNMFVSFAAAKPAEMLAKACTGQAAARPSAFMLGRMGCYADWVLEAALRHPAAENLLRQLGLGEEGEAQQEDGAGDGPDRQAGSAGFCIRLVRGHAREDEEEEAFRLTAQPDEALVEDLCEAFAQTPERQALQGVAAKRSVSSLAKGDESPLRRRPSLMYATGLTAAEKGVAQHSFMQYANFAQAAVDVEEEIQRLVRDGYIAAAVAGAVDREGMRRFLASALAARMAQAEKVLREYDFITAVPAGLLQPELPQKLAQEPVLVQGIADLILVRGGQVEIIDYKTDRGIAAEALAQRYRQQLLLYSKAIEKRLGLPVGKLTVWSFALGCEVDVR